MQEKKINTNEIILKTNSPILIENEKNQPLLLPPLQEKPGLSTFNEHFNIIHNKILQDLRGENENKKGNGLYERLEFEPIK